MEISEETKEVRDLLQSIIKSKKTLRMYPQNNPVYVKTLEDAHIRFNSFFDYKDTFTLKIKQNSIYYDAEQLYYNPEKEDNFALFFFKDGLRELSFKKGLTQEELEDFLRIIALDFDREAIDDDIVTLLWEKDFQNIKYIVDEAYLLDADEENYQDKAEEKTKEQVTDVDDLMRAYADGFAEEDIRTVLIVPLSEKDLQLLLKELEKDLSDNKVYKLVNILFELIYTSEDKSDLEDIYTFIQEAILFSMKHGDIHAILDIMKRAQEVIDNPMLSENEKRYMRMLPVYLGTEDIITLLADLLDSGVEIEEKDLENLVQFLDKNAIEPMVKCLGELKTIRARKSIIEALIVTGKKDIQTLSKGLDDQRWYVVRNIIYILRRIGDKRATEYLLRTVRHGDIRVRKEVIKAFGELGGKEVIHTLRECLDDPDMQVRIVAAKAFASIGTEAPKRIILDEIYHKDFKDKEFEEKKEFYEVLSRWKDSEVFEFLIKTIKTTPFFGRAKNYENRACAAFCLGLLGNKDALPVLEKYKDSNNKLLRDFTYAAIKKLEYGQ